MLQRMLRIFLCLLACASLTAQATTKLVVRGLPDDPPLTLAVRHDGKSLRIGVDLQRGWHLYGRDVGGGQPVTVTITGGDFAADGPLQVPMDASGQVTGKAELTLPLRRTGTGNALAATMGFMVCDALQCLPPVELELKSVEQDPQEPLRVLLVAVEEGERSQRIGGFLREHGCVPTVTTWQKVTSELCDANDVVIADSLTFGAMRGRGVKAGDFPATRSPVVAVGFLGTDLLKARRIAMASGYI